MKPRALIIDRDGTLIEHVPYLQDPSGVKLLPTVKESLRRARSEGLLLFMHSNQSGVGRGLFGLDAVEACNRRMMDLLEMGPAPFERICIAPEAPDQPAVYRKPSPRFATEIMHDFGLRPEEICYMGDRGSDLETARRAGTRGAGICTGLDDLALELKNLGLEGVFPMFNSFSQALSNALNP